MCGLYRNLTANFCGHGNDCQYFKNTYLNDPAKRNCTPFKSSQIALDQASPGFEKVNQADVEDGNSRSRKLEPESCLDTAKSTL